MPQITTSVSIVGDKVYVSALKALAAAQGMTIGELVRAATDEKYGNDLEPHISFFTKRGSKNCQSNAKATKRG